MERVNNFAIIKTMLSINRLLAKRISKLNILYFFLVTIFLVVMSAVSLSIYIDFKGFSKNIDQSMNSILYLIMMFTIFLITLRFSTETVILLNKIPVFPLSPSTKYLFLLLLLIYDFHSLIFIIPILIISIKLFLEFGLGCAFLYLLFFYCLFALIVVWISDFYIIFARWLDKLDKNILIIYPILSLIFVLMQNRNEYSALKYFPLFGLAGKAIQSLKVSSYSHYMLSLLACLILTIFGYFLGNSLIKRLSYQ
jgi:hypothetical protein